MLVKGGGGGECSGECEGEGAAAVVAAVVVVGRVLELVFLSLRRRSKREQ